MREQGNEKKGKAVTRNAWRIGLRVMSSRHWGIREIDALPSSEASMRLAGVHCAALTVNSLDINQPVDEALVIEYGH